MARRGSSSACRKNNRAGLSNGQGATRNHAIEPIELIIDQDQIALKNRIPRESIRQENLARSACFSRLRSRKAMATVLAIDPSPHS